MGGFSDLKISVAFVCKDNRIISPLCEAIFSSKIKAVKLQHKFNIPSSASIENDWGNSCPEKLVKFMSEKHDLDLSMHESDDVIVPIGYEACNYIRKYYKSGMKVMISNLTDNSRNNQEIQMPDWKSTESIEKFYQECDLAVEQ